MLFPFIRLLVTIAWQQHWKKKVQSCDTVMLLSRQRPRQVMHLPVVEPTFAFEGSLPTVVMSLNEDYGVKLRGFLVDRPSSRNGTTSTKSVDNGSSSGSTGRQKAPTVTKTLCIELPPLKEVGRSRTHKASSRSHSISNEQQRFHDNVHEASKRNAGRSEQTASKRSHIALPNHTTNELPPIHHTWEARSPEHPPSLSPMTSTSRTPTPESRQKSDIKPSSPKSQHVSRSPISNDALHSNSAGSYTETKHYVSPALSGVNGLANAPRKKSSKRRSPRRSPQIRLPARPPPLVLPVVSPEFGSPWLPSRGPPPRRLYPVETMGLSMLLR